MPRKKKSSRRKKSSGGAASLRVSLLRKHLRLPHGYEITKRKSRRKKRK